MECEPAHSRGCDVDDKRCLTVTRHLRSKGVDILAERFDQRTSPSGEKLLESEIVIGRGIGGNGDQPAHILTEEEVRDRASATARPVLDAVLTSLSQFSLRKRAGGKSLSFDVRTPRGDTTGSSTWTHMLP